MVIRKDDPRYFKTRLKKPCGNGNVGCGKMFRPTSRFTKLCDKCQLKSRRKIQAEIVKRNKQQKEE